MGSCTRIAHLNHIIPRLIIIQVKMNHKDDKALSHKTVAFSGFELETSS